MSPRDGPIHGGKEEPSLGGHGCPTEDDKPSGLAEHQ
ncbi:hypothetical protein LEMLEM_LOCUS22139 [Lemmus lemmus]